MIQEIPVVFTCDGNRLIGLAALPDMPAEIGLLIIVGGPQYRAGSHRQFTLLARSLAHEGFASFRFDYRGMGDSEGGFRNFEGVDDDICAAIDTFQGCVPAVRKVVLWGLCDAASAALYYAHSDPRIVGITLLNPWVHSEAGASRARFTNYYLTRLMQPSFWGRLFRGEIKIRGAVGGFAQSARQVGELDTGAAPLDPRHGSAGYIDRMFSGLKAFSGKTRIVLSGEDLVAREFEQLQQLNKNWRKVCASPCVEQCRVDMANHTFSSVAWRGEVEMLTANWLRSLR